MTAPDLVGPGVYRVDAIGPGELVSVLLIEDDGGWTLVDTGMTKRAGRIQRACAALGVGPDALKQVVITHHHGDHTAGLPGVLGRSPGAEVAATAYEAAIVAGQQGRDLPSNPVLGRIMRSVKPPEVRVRRTLRDGDVVSGFRVIDTPGHTLGHISLLRDEDGLLLTGDAFGCLPRKVRVGVAKALCADPALAKRSAEELLEEDFDTVVFAHGPVLRSGGKAVLRHAVELCGY